MNRIGIDIGGTFIKGGIVDEKGKILFYTKVPTFDKKYGVIDNLYSLIKDLIETNNKISEESISFIGLGVPGIVDREKGIAKFSGNLSWHNLPIIELIHNKGIKIPMQICNDSKCACIGEMLFGAGKYYKNTIVMTIGTGIGAGIVVDGKLFEGNKQAGGEIGHVSLIVDGIDCTCGRCGCFEVYASAQALIRYTREEMKLNSHTMMWNYSNHDLSKIDGELAFKCAKMGDKSAIKVVDKYVKYLSEGLLNICNSFRPESIIIGGGISEQGNFLFDKINSYVIKKKYGFKNTPVVEIVQAKLGNKAGLVGAAFMNEFLGSDN